MCLKDLNLRLEFAEKKGQVDKMDKMDKMDKRRVTVFHALEMSFLWAFCLFFPSRSSMFISSDTFLPRHIIPSSCHHAICQLSSILLNQVWLSCDSKPRNSQTQRMVSLPREIESCLVPEFWPSFFGKKTAPRFAPWSRVEPWRMWQKCTAKKSHSICFMSLRGARVASDDAQRNARSLGIHSRSQSDSPPETWQGALFMYFFDFYIYFYHFLHIMRTSILSTLSDVKLNWMWMIESWHVFFLMRWERIKSDTVHGAQTRSPVRRFSSSTRELNSENFKLRQAFFRANIVTILSHMKDMGPTCVSHKPHMYHMCQATSATRRTVGQLHCMTAWLTSVASLRIFSPNWSIHFGTITLHTYTMLHSVTPFLVEKAQCFIKKCQKAGVRYGERGERNSLGKRASENLVRQRARFCDATWRQLGFIFFLTLSMSLRIEVVRCKAPLVLIHSSVWTYDIRL